MGRPLLPLSRVEVGPFCRLLPPLYVPQFMLQAIAFVIAIAAVCYSVVTTCVESRAMDLEAQPVDDTELLPYRPEFFHAIFGLASAYLCMLYLSWNLDTLPSLSGDGKFQVRVCPAYNLLSDKGIDAGRPQPTLNAGPLFENGHLARPVSLPSSWVVPQGRACSPVCPMSRLCKL